jgi:trigger factor
MDEEQLAHQAEPDAAQGLRRDAVIVAVIEAEQIQPSDDDVLQALTPTAKRAGVEPEQLLERLQGEDRIERVRQDVAQRQAVDLLVREATPISIAAAQAREALWTPGKEEQPGEAPGTPAADKPSEIWLPGS